MVHTVLRKSRPFTVDHDPTLIEGGGAHPSLHALNDGDVLTLEHLIDVSGSLNFSRGEVAGLEVEVSRLRAPLGAIRKHLQDHEVAPAGISQQARVWPQPPHRMGGD